MLNDAVRLCALCELPDPGTYEFSVGGGDWPLRGFVVRYRDRIYAFENRCPHAGLPLNFKPNQFFAPDLELLQCTVHGALFAPNSGMCVAGPCAGRSLRMLEIELENDVVYLRDQSEK